MPFPNSKRVFYNKNPLQEVVCQLNFPPILKIETEAPAAFQERIRNAFPLYQRTVNSTQVNIPAGLPPQLLQLLASAGTATHEFLSSDGVWKLTLTRDFLSLTTSKYHDWEDFIRRLTEPLAAFDATYQPAFFQRVGLRYLDRIDRDKLGLKNVEWSELLAPCVLGELGDRRVSPHVVHLVRELIVRLTEEFGNVRIVHGIDDENGTYVIDSDFFSEKQTPIQGARDVLNGFNQRAGRLFRWCIAPRLHDAMGPRDV
jgi:uncharacterized protein (TIGR04255 family)